MSAMSVDIDQNYDSDDAIEDNVFDDDFDDDPISSGRIDDRDAWKYGCSVDGCIMQGLHTRDECHTTEMAAEQFEADAADAALDNDSNQPEKFTCSCPHHTCRILVAHEDDRCGMCREVCMP